MLRVDECYNRLNQKVRVKPIKSYIDSHLIIGNYYLFYDEDEVYHIESALSCKVIRTFRCNSWNKAMLIALLSIYYDFIELIPNIAP